MEPVSLKAVADEMDILPDGWIVYINRKTGELYTVSEDEHRYIEDDEDDDEDIPEWQKEVLPKAREVVESDDFIELPNKYDIHEYSIMERFCGSVEDDDLRTDLLDAIRGRGAFRRFKELIFEEEIQDQWFAYKDNAIKRIAADFLDAQGIPFFDED